MRPVFLQERFLLFDDLNSECFDPINVWRDGKRLQSAGGCSGSVHGAIVKKNCFGGGGSEFTNGGFKNFGIRFLQVHFLTQENAVEKVIELVAVCVEPIFATIFPMQFVGVAQERNACDAFCFAQFAERLQFVVGDSETN